MGHIDSDFGKISRSKYYFLMKKSQEFEYREFTKVTPTEAESKSQTIKSILCRILTNLELANEQVLYYDSSMIQDYSFKRKCWTGNNCRNILHINHQMKNIKLLSVLSNDSFVSLQFFKNLENQDMYDFLKASIDNVRSSNNRKRIWLFLDNATVHKSAEFQAFAKTNSVNLIFNAVRNPKFNIVEDHFEFLKRNVRLNYKMSPREVIASIIDQARDFNAQQQIRVRHQQLRAFQESLEETVGFADRFKTERSKVYINTVQAENSPNSKNGDFWERSGEASNQKNEKVETIVAWGGPK